MVTINDLQIINGWNGTKAWFFGDSRYESSSIYLDDKWKRGLAICNPAYPVIVLSTNNVGEMELRRFLPTLKGAKRVYHKDFPNYDTDPYGRRVQRGMRSYDIWDLRGVFCVTKDISEFLDFEDNERLKSLNK